MHEAEAKPKSGRFSIYPWEGILMIAFEFKKQGEKFKVLKTSADTNEERVEMAFTLAPAACGPPLHIHTRQVEWFEVISGRMIKESTKKSTPQKRARGSK